ncbi:MAG: tetratricopeptide repeat protein [Bacteroidia bacterium]|nr:tetratricopeptide repeat protein [Bacteroidia bacterium]
MNKRHFLLFFCLVFTGSLSWFGFLGVDSSNNQSLTEAKEARQKVYQAYSRNQPTLWPAAIATLKRLSSQAGNQNPDLLYEWCLAEYGYLGYCIGTKATHINIDDRLDDLEDALDDLLDLKEDFPPAEAMMGAVIAMQIGMSPATAIYQGPRSSSYISDALEHGPNSPEAWVEKGNMRFHAPALFGGDMKEAIKCFAKAADLFAKNPSIASNNWLYLHALAWLGQAYEKEGQWANAKLAYQRALSVEPNFQWVKSELLPSLERRN